MGELIFGMCALTSLLCAYLLLNRFLQKKSRLLLWSALCFVGLALNNSLLVVDRLIGSAVDLSVVRLVPALVGMMLLIYGLIWENE